MVPDREAVAARVEERTGPVEPGATKVVRLLVSLADEMGLVACAHTRPGNVGSERVLAKGGFECVGEDEADGMLRRVWRRPGWEG